MVRKEYEGEQWKFPFVVYKPDKVEDGLPVIIQLQV